MKKFNKVLIIDGSPLSSLLSRTTLQQTDLAEDIIEVGSGLQALNWLTREEQMGNPPPDLVLLNLQMPIRDGFAFLETLARQAQGEVLLHRIVVLTSSVSRLHQQKAHQLGVKYYFYQPLTPDAIHQAVEGIVACE